MKLIYLMQINDLNKDTADYSNNLTKVYYGFEYKDPLRRMLLEYKYYKLVNLKWVLGYLLEHRIRQIGMQINIDYIVPVPLHKIREYSRGFNHVLSLLDYYRIVNGKWIIRTDILVKNKLHKPQNGLSKNQRINNLTGTFKVTENLRGKDILIIDDVYTTGSTVSVIAYELKLRGANNVYAFTLFKAL